MAYGFNPIANDVKLANLGQIYAQNQQAQMQMDNNQLQQQSVLAGMARQQAAERQAQQAQDLVSQQGFDINNPQAAVALANLNPELFKTLSDGQKARAEREYRQAQTQNIGVDNARADMVANSTIQNQSFDNQIKAQTLQISRGQLAARQNELKASIGDKETKAFMEVNALVAAAPPEQQAAVAQQAMQLLQNRFPNGQFAKFDANEDLADMVALGSAVNTINSKGKANSEVDFKSEMKLREEFTKQQKAYKDVTSAYSAIDRLSKSNSPANQMSLIYNFMKLQDPESVVRESEFAMAAKAGSYGDALQNAATKLISGQRLTENQVKDFVSASKNLYDAQRGNYEKSKTFYRGLAEQYSLSPDRVTYDPESQQPTNAQDAAQQPAAQESYVVDY